MLVDSVQSRFPGTRRPSALAATGWEGSVGAAHEDSQGCAAHADRVDHHELYSRERAALFSHNPEVEGSNPSPATIKPNSDRYLREARKCRQPPLSPVPVLVPVPNQRIPHLRSIWPAIA